jgi:hypothetical protein
MLFAESCKTHAGRRTIMTASLHGSLRADTHAATGLDLQQ